MPSKNYGKENIGRTSSISTKFGRQVHLPLFYINGVGQEGHSYIAFGIGVFGMSFALACIRKCTDSVWLCVLLHCIVNASGAVCMINDGIIGKASKLQVSKK